MKSDTLKTSVLYFLISQLYLNWLNPVMRPTSRRVTHLYVVRKLIIGCQQSARAVKIKVSSRHVSARRVPPRRLGAKVSSILNQLVFMQMA